VTRLVRRRAPYVAVAVAALVATLAPGGRTPAADKPPPVRTPDRVHEVQRGETLSAIARRHGVTVRALLLTNRLSRGVSLRAGQTLTIPAPAAGPPTRSAALASTRPRTATAGPASPGRPVVPAASPPWVAPVPEARIPESFVLSIPDLDGAMPAFTWPVEGPVTSVFGRRHGGWHPGIDIKADLGTPVLAAAAGVVVTSGVEPRYGRVVKIEHDKGFVTVYAHNETNFVEVGDRVLAGAPVGTVGRTGRATAEHLHFEIRHEARVYNPLYLLPLPARVAQVEDIDLDEDMP
jgi:murein DD-endopeptidase MepM/ murein hydrolase activator NlpD